jgi:hypothetical protein
VPTGIRGQPRVLGCLQQLAAMGGGQLLVDVAVEDHGVSLIVDSCTMAIGSHKVK